MIEFPTVAEPAMLGRLSIAVTLRANVRPAARISFETHQRLC